ncbi:MAG: DUF6446 family protein [Paracoccaceae bacterium]|nr:DUF6446 family protein [Paracoccaceae bacterium]
MGKFLAIVLVLCGVGAGIGMYYLQIYAFYEEVVPNGSTDVQLTAKAAEVPETILYQDYVAIDSESSPIRYRACFTTPTTLQAFADTYEAYAGAVPRVAPGWFDCFDAEAIGAEIANGTAQVFVGQRNFEYGIDRVVAITEDGRGYVWHEVNECGDKAYDGSPLGKDCPPRDGEN